MATLHWDRMGWEEFVTALEAYSTEISAKPNEDFAYLRCLGLLRGKSMEDRAARAPLIVEFLNNWNCRLKATETRIRSARGSASTPTGSDRWAASTSSTTGCPR